MRRLLLIAALLLLSVTTASAATYYVATTGSDAAAGTIGAPFLTILKGLSVLVPGDTLNIRAGTYTPASPISDEVSPIIPSGTSGNLITIQGYPGDALPRLMSNGFQGAVILVGGAVYTVWKDLILDASDGIAWAAPPNNRCTDGLSGGGLNNRFENLELIGSGDTVRRGIGISQSQGGHGSNTFVNVEAHDFSSHGMYIHGTNNVFDKLNIHHNGLSDGACSGDPGNQGGYGIQIYSGYQDPSGNTVKNSRFHHNRLGGIEVHGTNSLIFNNLVYGNGLNGIQVSDRSGTKLYNNTTYANGQLTSGYGIYLSVGDLITARNNILYGNTLDDNVTIGTATNVTKDHNLEGTGPTFVNAGSEDFHLLSGSPASAAGVTVASVTVDKDGVTRPNPPAIGAYEISGASPGSEILENFDSYSAGTSLQGLNGGTGWTSAWVVSAGTFSVETGLTTRALRSSSAVDGATASRNFTAQSGLFNLCWKMSQSTITPNQYSMVVLLDGSTFQLTVAFGPDGNLGYGTGAPLTALVTGYVANTVYTVCIDVDTGGQPGKYRIRVDGGSWSAWTNSSSTFTSLSGFQLEDYATNAHAFGIDVIDNTPIVAGGSIVVTGPVAGQVCQRPAGCPITWASNDITGDVVLTYKLGTQSYAIATLPYNDYLYLWDAAMPATTAAQVCVTQAAITHCSEEFIVRGPYFK